VLGQLPEPRLPQLLKDAEGGWNGERLRTLADRLSLEDKSLAAIEAALAAQKRSLMAVMIEAATGKADAAPKDRRKEWKAHGRVWFKSIAGGDELAGYALADDVWPKLEDNILPLLNAILTAVDRAAIERLDRV